MFLQASVILSLAGGGGGGERWHQIHHRIGHMVRGWGRWTTPPPPWTTPPSPLWTTPPPWTAPPPGQNLLPPAPNSLQPMYNTPPPTSLHSTSPRTTPFPTLDNTSPLWTTPPLWGPWGLLRMWCTECLTMGISWILLPNLLFGDSHKVHRHQYSSREVVTIY